MKKVLVSLMSGLLLMVFASLDSYAETCGPFGDMVRGFQEEGMPMMPPIRDYGMGKMEGMPEAEHPMWKHLMDLSLDEKQKEKLSEIRNRIVKEMIRKRAEERIAVIEMKELLDKDAVDLKKVEMKLKQIETLKTEMQLSLIRAAEEIRTKLTPEQRNKFKKAIKMGPRIEDRGMMERMMRGRMRVPPPYDIQNEMHSEMEHMPGPPLHEIPMQRDIER